MVLAVLAVFGIGLVTGAYIEEDKNIIGSDGPVIEQSIEGEK